MWQRIIDDLTAYNARLVAVSKTRPIEAIEALYEQGQRLFGENRVQEMTDKQPLLPQDVQWHQIGHLQTNKVKYIAPFVSMIHSVDSAKVLKEINKQAARNERSIKVLLQFKIAQEDSKYGFDMETVRQMLDSEAFAQMQHVKVCGLMGMATFTDEQEQVRAEFRQLRQYFETLKKEYFLEKEDFVELSMGMSGDYKIALEEGSTMVRVGSLLFQ
ncbi:MAG: YggS family pyridoxal phosphate-dependent enzyme [Bacteroidota bacterium]